MPELPRRQVTAPVRFTDLVLRLGELGVRAVLEVGPGRVLSGLVRRIDRDLVRGALGGGFGAHDRPKGPFTFERNRCSRSPETRTFLRR